MKTGAGVARLRELLENDVWLTADEREIPIAKMGDSHLRNTISYLIRKLQHESYSDDLSEVAEAYIRKFKWETFLRTADVEILTPWWGQEFEQKE